MTARRGMLSKPGISAGDDVIFTGDLDFLGEILFVAPVGKPVTIKASVGETSSVFEIQDSGGVFTAGIAFNGHVFGTRYCFPDGTQVIVQDGANTEIRAGAAGAVEFITDAGTMAFKANGVLAIPGTISLDEQVSPPSQGSGAGHFWAKATAPVEPHFVDDTNVDHILAYLNVARTTGIQSFNLTTTLADVTGLTAAMRASKVYKVRAVLFASVGGGGLQAALNDPTGAADIQYVTRIFQTTGMGSIERRTAYDVGTGSSSATVIMIIIDGYIKNNATPGTLAVRAAQEMDNGTDSDILEGSTLEVQEIS